MTRKGDYIAIILLATIIGSGFFLEASKIISWPVFDQMMEDFGVMIDAKEEPALEVYWQQAFNVRFEPPLKVYREKDPRAFMLLAIRNLAVLTLCKCCFGALKQAAFHYAMPCGRPGSRNSTSPMPRIYLNGSLP